MAKVKTSIYIDRELWEKFKKLAMKRGVKVSKLLEELIRRELLDELFDELIDKMNIAGELEIDFEPIEPRGGMVSDLMRVMRDERDNNLSRS